MNASARETTKRPAEGETTDDPRAPAAPVFATPAPNKGPYLLREKDR